MFKINGLELIITKGKQTSIIRSMEQVEGVGQMEAQKKDASKMDSHMASVVKLWPMAATLKVIGKTDGDMEKVSKY